jgi:IS5 family transposase
LEELISRTKRILTQKQKDKNKLYALHAPEVECLARGKACKPYEFGVKVIRRRSAIEPAIGHMKADGKLDCNWLKGALGDAMHAVLCGAGHNLRMILRKLRLFYVLILVTLLSFKTAAPSAARPHSWA